MSERTGFDFQVYHGTISPKEHLMDGISGHPAFHNVASDPFLSVAWARERGGVSRLSIWDVTKEDVRLSRRLKSGGIQRPYSEDEKRKHFTSFKKNVSASPDLRRDFLRPHKTIEDTLVDESEKENGLLGESLALVIDFTEKQATYLRRYPWTMQADIISWADNEVGGVSYTSMESDFLKGFPDLARMQLVYERKGNKKVEKRGLLKKLFAQSLYSNCLELVVGDNLNFSQEVIANLESKNVLEKPAAYYSSRDFYYRFRPKLLEVTGRLKAEAAVFYPELKNLE